MSLLLGSIPFSISESDLITSSSTDVESFSNDTIVFSGSATGNGLGFLISETITKNSTKWNPEVPSNINSYTEYFVDAKKFIQLTDNNQPVLLNLDDENSFQIQMEEYSLLSPDVWNRVTFNGTVIDLPVPNIHTYRGHVIGEEANSDVRFTISENWLSAQIQTSEDTFYIETINSKLDSDQYYSYKKSDTGYFPIIDEVIDMSKIKNHSVSEINLNGFSLIPYAEAQVVRTALLILDCDMEYDNIDPNTTDSRRVAVLNNINPVYANLGIEFVVVGFQCDLTNTELNSTDSGDLRDQLRDRWKFNPGQRHIVHLFSGKDLDSSTIGIAFIAGVNQPLDFGYSITQNVADSSGAFSASSTELRDLLAHEIGHNFDALHSEQGKCIFILLFCWEHDTIMRTGDPNQGVGFDDPNTPDTFAFSDGSLNANRDNELRISNTIQSSLTNLTPISCVPPTSGDWVLHSSCILFSHHTALGDVILDTNNQNPLYLNYNVNLIINPGTTLNIDFTNHKLVVKSGSTLLIKSGATIT